jgi:cytochrome P450
MSTKLASSPSENGYAPPPRGGSLPPGPALPSAVQAVGWALRPLPFLVKCRERYGDIFTVQIRRGRPWVFLSNPEDVGKVLTITRTSSSPAPARPTRCWSRCWAHAR